MSDNESDKEREFFETGAKSYLDVDDAMAQWRRMVQDQVTTLINRRLEEINRACGTEWTPNELKDYTERQPDKYLAGKWITVENFGGVYFYLGLSRGERDSLTYEVFADLFRQRQNLAKALWNGRSACHARESSKNTLGFLKTVPSGEISEFPKYLDMAIDAFIKCVGDRGGLKTRLRDASVSE